VIRKADLRLCQAGKPDVQYVRLSSLTRGEQTRQAKGDIVGTKENGTRNIFVGGCASMQKRTKNADERGGTLIKH